MTSLVMPSGSKDGTVASRKAASLVVVCVFVVLLTPTWITFPSTWLAERTHGFLVAAYCVWAVYLTRDNLRPSSDLLARGALFALVCGLLWAVATIVGARVVHQAAAVSVLLSLGAMLYGRRGLRELWPLAAIFVLALPLWEVLVVMLQSMTVRVNQLLVTTFGITATLERNLIHFPFGTIEVAQSCAGLGFLTSALSISVIYAHYFQRSLKARLLTVSISVVLALISNWIRVFGLVVIGYRTKMQSPLMADHGFYGWIIFSCVMVVFFTLATHVDQWERRRLGSGPANKANAYPSVEVRLPLVLAVSIGASLPILAYLLLSARSPNVRLPESIPGLFVPVGWNRSDSSSGYILRSTADSTNGGWVPALVGEQFRQQAIISPNGNGIGSAVQVDRFGYSGNRQGHELIGYDNSIALDEQLIEDRIVGPLDSNLRTVRQALVRTKRGVRIVWYWYRVAGLETAQPSRAKLLELIAFIHRATPSELVAVSASCGPKDCQKALESVHLVATGRPLNTTTIR
jgi:exosortase